MLAFNWRPVYFFCGGGKFFSNFAMALSRFFWFFSWLPLGLSVFVAVPVQTSCLLVGSYISRTRLPLLIVELVALPIPPKRAPPMLYAFHCFSLSTET